MALKTDIRAEVRALLTGSTDLADASAPHALVHALSWGSGTGASLADLVWGDERTLAASANEDLDLAGSLTGALGGTVTFARVKMLMVSANAGNTNNVVVGGAASNQFVGPFGAATHTVSLAPNGCLLLANPSATGWAVTASTGDLLRLANSAGSTSVTYKILIVGASA